MLPCITCHLTLFSSFTGALTSLLTQDSTQPCRALWPILEHVVHGKHAPEGTGGGVHGGVPGGRYPTMCVYLKNSLPARLLLTFRTSVRVIAHSRTPLRTPCHRQVLGSCPARPVTVSRKPGTHLFNS